MTALMRPTTYQGFITDGDTVNAAPDLAGNVSSTSVTVTVDTTA